MQNKTAHYLHTIWSNSRAITVNTGQLSLPDPSTKLPDRQMCRAAQMQRTGITLNTHTQHSVHVRLMGNVVLCSFLSVV